MWEPSEFREARQHVRGAKASHVLVRYADDFVILIRNDFDVHWLCKELPQRFDKHGLALHPEKTRLIPFKQPPRKGPKWHVSFDFLGFIHAWMRSLKCTWVMRQTMSRKRRTRALVRLREWMSEHRNDPIRTQHHMLGSKLRGLYAYFGLPGIAAVLASVRNEVRREWRKWLSRRRSARGNALEALPPAGAALPSPSPKNLNTQSPVANPRSDEPDG